MILKGDVFCVQNPSWLGRSIQFMERVWAEDGSATYSHAGIILQSTGETFEALWTIRKSHLRNYIGKQILIGRPLRVPPQLMEQALLELEEEHGGQWYPWWRLGLHTLPILSKWVSTGQFPVCSELAAKFLLYCGITEIGRWPGYSPDDLADAIKKWKVFDIIYEGAVDESIFS